MKNYKLLIALPAVAMLAATVPTQADARTKDIVKYGAIGLGVAALSNYAQQNNNRGYYQQQQPYYGGGYYQQPSYSGYYQQQQPYYGGGYYQQPSYGYSNYSYSYSQPSYGYGYR